MIFIEMLQLLMLLEMNNGAFPDTEHKVYTQEARQSEREQEVQN